MNLLLSALAVTLSACSPTHDWRVADVDGSGAQAMFPCRPDRHERTVRVADAPVRMQMLVCTAGGITYGLSFFDVAQPADSTGALAALRQSAVANVAGTAPQFSALKLAGMTPNQQAAQLSVQGRLPDGSAVQEQAAFFAKGLRVYQASAVGATLAIEAIEPFFSGMKLRP